MKDKNNKEPIYIGSRYSGKLDTNFHYFMVKQYCRKEKRNKELEK